MFVKILEGLGSIDPDTRMLLSRLAVRAAKSGNANLYIKERILWVLNAEDSPHPPKEWTLTRGS